MPVAAPSTTPRPAGRAPLLGGEAGLAARRRVRGDWYRPARTPIPAEPGYPLVVGLVHAERERRGTKTEWDDRPQTRINLLRRVLWTRAAGEGSALFACTVAELVIALGRAGISAWGPVPEERAERTAYIANHRVAVQRWLKQAEACGLLRVRGERDGGNHWWRTLIELLPAPAIEPERMAKVRAREKAFKRRQRRRQARRRPPRSDLGRVRANAAALSRAERKRRHLQRARRRRTSARITTEKVLMHPYGTASPLSGAQPQAEPPGNAKCSDQAYPNRRGVTATPSEVPSLRSQSAGRQRSRGASPPHQQPHSSPNVTDGDEGRFGHTDRADAAISRSLGGVFGPHAPSRHADGMTPHPSAAGPQIAEMSPEGYAAAIQAIRSCQPGTRIDGHLAELLVQAWTAERWGIAGAIARPHWRPRVAIAKLQAGVDAYEQHAGVRPAGWPESGLAALLLLATWIDPGSYRLDGRPFRFDRPDHLPAAVGMLDAITGQMRRHARRPARIQSAMRRARRQAAAGTQQEPRPRFNFRSRAAAAGGIIESPAQTYERIGRQLLAAGDHAAHYPSLEEAELALIEHEAAGRVPEHTGQSPAAARRARMRGDGGARITTVEASAFARLLADAGQWLPADEAGRLSSIEPVALHDGRLVVAADHETIAWARRAHIVTLLARTARLHELAHSVTLIEPRYRSAFEPTLRGPADHRAAVADRYADERTHRFAIVPASTPNEAPR